VKMEKRRLSILAQRAMVTTILQERGALFEHVTIATKRRASWVLRTGLAANCGAPAVQKRQQAPKVELQSNANI